MKCQLLALVSTGVLATSWAWAAQIDAQPPENDRAKQLLLGLVAEWAAAENRHDANGLRQILDKKFVFTSDDEGPSGREVLIRNETGGEVDPAQTQDLTNESVILDGDTGIVVGVDTVRGKDHGVPYSMVLKFTITFVHRHGHWVALAAHVSEVKAK